MEADCSNPNMYLVNTRIGPLQGRFKHGKPHFAYTHFTQGNDV